MIRKYADHLTDKLTGKKRTLDTIDNFRNKTINLVQETFLKKLRVSKHEIKVEISDTSLSKNTADSKLSANQLPLRTSKSLSDMAVAAASHCHIIDKGKSKVTNYLSNEDLDNEEIPGLIYSNLDIGERTIFDNPNDLASSSKIKIEDIQPAGCGRETFCLFIFNQLVYLLVVWKYNFFTV